MLLPVRILLLLCSVIRIVSPGAAKLLAAEVGRPGSLPGIRNRRARGAGVAEKRVMSLDKSMSANDLLTESMVESRMKMMKNIVKGVVGEGNLGRYDFFRHPRMQYSWGGPFNGQKFRQRIFFDLLYYLPIKAIVETGTFRGVTTALFATTSLPVYTVEIQPRFFAYAKMRFLLNRSYINLFHSDSRTFLRNLSADSSIPKDEHVFFYLDAHWREDLPLREELEIIFSTWNKPIVMVDDFLVPGSDYKFDDYGPGKVLDLSYIEPVRTAHKVSAFFPAVNSSEETGARRGSVVLCDEMSGMELDAKCRTLVREGSCSCNSC